MADDFGNQARQLARQIAAKRRRRQDLSPQLTALADAARPSLSSAVLAGMAPPGQQERLQAAVSRFSKIDAQPYRKTIGGPSRTPRYGRIRYS